MESSISQALAVVGQKKKPATDLESLPTELRQMIYSHTLGRARVFHIKTQFIRGNLLRPFEDQWLVPVGTRTAGAMRVNKDMNKLYYDEIMKCAVSGATTKIVVNVNDFDFRPLATFLESLPSNIIEKIKAAKGNKLVAVLSVAKDENEKCANNLRAWFNFRKETDRRVPVTYYFKEVASRGHDMLSLMQILMPWKSHPGADIDIDGLLGASVKLDAVPEAVEQELTALYEELEEVADSAEVENSIQEAVSRTVKAFKEAEDRKPAEDRSTVKRGTMEFKSPPMVAPSEVLKVQSNHKNLASYALVYGGAFHDESDDGSFHDGSNEESLDEDANEDDSEDEQDVEEEEAATGGSKDEDDDEWMTDTDDDADPECEGEMEEVKEWQVEKFGKELRLPSSRSGNQDR